MSIGADIGLPHADFRAFSLTIFIGLLAFDWLRVLIWFDHMGLRVATLVNLTFVGGDRLDEAAGRFVGHAARARVIPDGVRRFATWAPLLIPFYIPRGARVGQGVDRGGDVAQRRRPDAGPGARARRRLCRRRRRDGARRPDRCRARAREKLGRAGPALAGAPAALGDLPEVFSFNNGAIGVELLRDGRGATFVLGAARDSFAIDLTRRPLDPLQSRGPFFYVTEEGEAPWSIGYEPARRAGLYSVEETGRNSLVIANEIAGLSASMEVGPDRTGRRSLPGASGSPISRAAHAGCA